MHLDSQSYTVYYVISDRVAQGPASTSLVAELGVSPDGVPDRFDLKFRDNFLLPDHFIWGNFASKNSQCSFVRWRLLADISKVNVHCRNWHVRSPKQVEDMLLDFGVMPRIFDINDNLLHFMDMVFE